MSYSKGVSWIGDCRIPFVDEGDTFMINKLEYQGKDWYKEGCEYKGIKEYNTQGRFTPNLLVCDDMLNDGTITKATAAGKKGKSGFVNGYESGDYDIPYGDKGTNSRYYDLDLWFDNMIDSL
jgi:hypothetical protein